MRHDIRVIGAVLAGGRSRRMGRDKALIEFDGTTLLARAVGVLESVFERVVVVAPADRDYERQGFEVAPDVEAGKGPLGGLRTALELAAGDPVFLLACDLPLVEAPVVRWIVEAAVARANADERGRLADVTLVVDGAGPQPLCALWAASSLPSVMEALEAGDRSVIGLLEHLDCERLEPESDLPWYRPDLFSNLNRPADLAPWRPEKRARPRPRPAPPPTRAAVKRYAIERYRDDGPTSVDDGVTVEEPLEIRVVGEESGRLRARPIAVTMRTPGADFELALGFLVSEGVIRRAADVWRVDYCGERSEGTEENVVDVYLAPGVSLDVERLSRNVLTSSACGICGRTSIESVRRICAEPLTGRLRVGTGVLSRLTERLEQEQAVFSRTGGLHAAALFDRHGELCLLREDVGRHNAFDKMVGALLEADCLPADQRLAVVSGRASFELVQKALLVGIPILVAVGAPSSLAIDLAAEYGMTLIGFLRREGFNIYCGSDRLVRS